MADETASARIRKIRVFKGKDGDFYLTALAGNGEEIWRASEGYESHHYARSVAERDFPGVEIVDGD